MTKPLNLKLSQPIPEDLITSNFHSAPYFLRKIKLFQGWFCSGGGAWHNITCPVCCWKEETNPKHPTLPSFPTLVTSICAPRLLRLTQNTNRGAPSFPTHLQGYEFIASTFHTSQVFYLFLLVSCFSVLGYPCV